MGTASDLTLGIVRRYVTEVQRGGIRLSAAVLFGSHARGNATEWSDIDVALVSEDFKGDRYADRCGLAGPTLAVDVRIDPLTFRPEDFADADPFVREILSTGIRIV